MTHTHGPYGRNEGLIAAGEKLLGGRCINLGRVQVPCPDQSVDSALEAEAEVRSTELSHEEVVSRLCWANAKSSPLFKAKAGSAAISTVCWKELGSVWSQSVGCMLSCLSYSLQEP